MAQLFLLGSQNRQGILSKEESVRLLQATSKSSSAEKSTVDSTGNGVITEPREAAETVSLVIAGIQVLSSSYYFQCAYSETSTGIGH
jgi:hypothetical protein